MDDTLELAVVNPSFNSVTIPLGFRVAPYEMIANPQQSAFASAIIPFGNTEHVVNVGGHLTNMQQNKLVSLLLANSDAFSLHDEIGRTDLAAHEISPLKSSVTLVYL